MARSWRVLSCFTLGCLAIACSTGEMPATPCTTDGECPAGTFCGPQHLCVFQCRKNADCPGGGSCTSRGRCQGGTSDGGLDGSAGDARPDAPREGGVRDGGAGDRSAEGLRDLRLPKDGLPTTCAAAIGVPCTQSGGECGAAASCLMSNGAEGVCTCNCTPDDPDTTGNEDSCPDLAQNVCGTVSLASGTKSSYCFRKCIPKLGSNDCLAPLACDPDAAALLGSGDQAVCLIVGCKSHADCPVLTSTVCDTATPSACTTAERCIALWGAAGAGRCAKAGNCDMASGLCGAHTLGKATAKVGDPCKDDTECGGAMTCRLSYDMAKLAKKQGASCSVGSECCSGVCQGGKCTKAVCPIIYRGGMCAIDGCSFPSLTVRACPSGSTCNRIYFGGVCQRSCSPGSASTCRGAAGDLYGDYECRSWNNLTLGGAPISSGPVCDVGPLLSCDWLQASNLDCTDLGDYNNFLFPNQYDMFCRTLDGKTTTSAHEPTGFCLDATASGSAYRNPMPTP